MEDVLKYLATHFSGSHPPQLRTPFVVDGIDVDQVDYPVILLGLTERGWEAAEGIGRIERASHDRDEVLKYLAHRFAGDVTGRLDTPFEVGNLDFDSQVVPVLRRLASADPPLIKVINVD